MYLRFEPRRVDSFEGRRHVATVPVKLMKCKFDEHQSHVDTIFCKTAIEYLDVVASILGPEQVFYMSRDDKVDIFN